MNLDAIFQQQWPTVMVPTQSSLPAITDGQRLLVSKSGLWLEIQTAWLSVVHPLALQSSLNIPYGELSKQLKTVPIAKAFLKEFGDFAKEQYPKECAARIVFHRETKVLRLERMIAKQATGSFVSYDIPVLSSDEMTVLDIHSHGMHSAFFSKTDDTDDKNDLKIAAVIGFPSGIENSLQVCFRLCLRGLFIPITPYEDSGYIQFNLQES